MYFPDLYELLTTQVSLLACDKKSVDRFLIIVSKASFARSSPDAVRLVLNESRCVTLYADA